MGEAASTCAQHMNVNAMCVAFSSGIAARLTGLGAAAAAAKSACDEIKEQADAQPNKDLIETEGLKTPIKTEDGVMVEDGRRSNQGTNSDGQTGFPDQDLEAFSATALLGI